MKPNQTKPSKDKLMCDFLPWTSAYVLTSVS